MKNLISYVLIVITFSVSSLNGQDKSKPDSKEFIEPKIGNDFQFTTVGKIDYFILEPGYKLIFEGKNGKDITRLIVTVLNETKKIGNTETRVVEENESVNNNTVEISRNYFAFCKQTNSIYYFGEDVDVYKNGKIVNHEGAWLAEGKNKPGIAMPGSIVAGAKYYQEIAPGVAMDRAEIISDQEKFETPAGKFNKVLKIKETTPLEPLAKEYKLYAPGIGLIKDEDLLLIQYGFKK